MTNGAEPINVKGAIYGDDAKAYQLLRSHFAAEFGKYRRIRRWDVGRLRINLSWRE